MNRKKFRDLISEQSDPKQKENLELVLRIAEVIKAAGGRALVVGGYPRDLILRDLGYNIEPKDLDIEVYGLESEKLESILGQFGRVNKVGASFAVYKVGEIDVALPRRDSKVGAGHRGFVIVDDPNMSFAEASKRRDFTINAIALDPLTGEVLDEHGGISDIENKILRACDYEQFGDDPLRVLRAMQFAGRFGFAVEGRTAEICRSLPLNELSKERIGDEWKKLLLKSPKPSVGLWVGKELLAFKKLHLEIEALFETPQEPAFHPEGNAGIHTLLVVDAMATITQREGIKGNEKLVLMLAALTHDLGKTVTTKKIKGVLRSYGHSEAGVELAEKFLREINMSEDIISRVLPLVDEHMVPAFSMHMKDAGVRRLARRLFPSTISELVLLSQSDQLGKGQPIKHFPKEEALLEKAKALAIAESAPKPLVLGRHLMAEDVEPGQEMGKIIEKLFQAQIEGKFSTVEEGLEYFRKHFKS